MKISEIRGRESWADSCHELHESKRRQKLDSCKLVKFVAEKAVNENGTRAAEVRYKPWGESRYTFGATPTQRRFTGQVLDEVAGGTVSLNLTGWAQE